MRLRGGSEKPLSLPLELIPKSAMGKGETSNRNPTERKLTWSAYTAHEREDARKGHGNRVTGSTRTRGPCLAERRVPAPAACLGHSGTSRELLGRQSVGGPADMEGGVCVETGAPKAARRGSPPAPQPRLPPDGAPASLEAPSLPWLQAWNPL